MEGRIKDRNKIAEFKIMTRSGEQMVDNYHLPYSSAEELNKLIQESREVWSEYYVVVETDLFTQSFSHTYSEELLSDYLKDCSTENPPAMEWWVNKNSKFAR
jgi:hypothetical protein